MSKLKQKTVKRRKVYKAPVPAGCEEYQATIEYLLSRLQEYILIVAKYETKYGKLNA